MTLGFIGGLGMQEILLIALVVLLFFGGKKIPELMKGLGKGVRSFKEGMNGIEKDLQSTPDDEQKKMSKKLGHSKFLGPSRRFTLRSDQDNRSVGCLWNRGIYL